MQYEFAEDAVEIIITIDLIVKDSEASTNAFDEVSSRINETGKLVHEISIIADGFQV